MLSQLLPNIETQQPIWLISNLSFQKDHSISGIFTQMQAGEHGVEIVNVKSGNWGHPTTQQGIWGRIPIFNLSESCCQFVIEFFQFLLDNKAPIMTLYVETNNGLNETISLDKLLSKSRFGKVINSKKYNQFHSGEDLACYIRSKIEFYELARKSQHQSQMVAERTDSIGQTGQSPLIAEIEELERRGKCILVKGRYKMFLTKFDDLKFIPNEIGRLRALTYAEIGEGSDKEIDLDAYDQTHFQLFLFETEKQEIIGGYRIGIGEELVKKYGISGLYIHQLYRIDDSMRSFLSRSIELGRSFIIPSHQKQHLPLFMLWQGILNVVQSNPQARHIIGLVSISRVFSDISRSLIISYLKHHHFEQSLALFFKPRQEFYSSSSEENLLTIIKVFNGEIIRLDEFISEIEPDHYRLPVLIRKYIQQSARFIGFNLDPDFSDCVDGLMVLDIQQLPSSTLQLLQSR